MYFRFITEKMEEVDEPTPAAISAVLRAKAFGTFAILDAGEAFVQTADEKQDLSDSWLLEFREAPGQKLHRAEGAITLRQVEDVFLAFLRGDWSWRARFKWSEIVLER